MGRVGKVVGQQAVGTVVVEEKRTHVEPAAAPAEDKATWNIFEYMDGMKPEDWETHRGYVYRVQPRISEARGEGYLMKVVEPFTIEDIREKFGGTVFRAVLKRGQERVADTTFTVEAPPKLQTENGNYAAHNPGGGGDVLRGAIDHIADPAGARAAVNLTQQAAISGFEMLRTAMPQNQLSLKDILDLMDRRAAAPPPGSGMPPWLETALASMVPALISKILTPDNPIDTFTKMVAALKESPFSMSGRASASDWKTELVSALPSVFDKGASMLENYAKVAEMQARRALPAAPPAGTVVPMPAQPAAVPMVQNPTAGIPPAAPASPSNAAPAAGAPVQEPPEIWTKQKLVEFFKEGRSGEEVGAWLDDTAPSWLNALVMFSPDQIIGFMREDPDKLLTQIADDPKMLAFLQALAKWAAEEDATTAVATAAVATQTPA